MLWWANWCARRTCQRDWELVGRQKILGASLTREWGGSYVDSHYA